MVGAQRIMRRHNERHTRIHPCELLNDNRIFDIPEARAAQLFWENRPHGAQLARLLNHLQWENLVFIPFQNMRSDLGFSEISDQVSELNLLRSEFEIHLLVEIILAMEMHLARIPLLRSPLLGFAGAYFICIPGIAR